LLRTHVLAAERPRGDDTTVPVLPMWADQPLNR
jgi:hypothetical protein